MHEVETINKVMSCVMDGDKNLVQKNKSAGGTKKMISVLITSSVDV
jgi:hypothetical protein